MPDGSVYAKVTLDDADAVKELENLKVKIQKLQDELNSKKARKSEIEKQMDAANASVEETRKRVEALKAALASAPRGEKAGLQSDLKIATAEYNQQVKEMDALNKEWIKLDSEIPRGEEQLKAMEGSAANVVKQIAASDSVMAKLASATQKAGKKMEAVFGRVKRAVERVFVYSVILAGLRALREYFTEVVKATPEASEALSKLQGALLTLAQPIIEVAIPAFVWLINIITQATTALASFFAALSGKSLKETAESASELYNEAKGLDKVGASAKKASKQLLGFDEINKLSDSDAGGNGGSAKSITPDFGLDETDSVLNNILGVVLAIGAGLAAWKIASTFTDGLSTTAIGVGLLAGGIALATLGLKDMYENGMTLANALETVTGIIAAGLGISLLTGSFIPALIAGLAAALLAIAYFTGHGEEFVEGLRKIFDGFAEFFEGVFSGDMDKAAEGLKKVWEGLKKSGEALIDGLEDGWALFVEWFNGMTNNKFKPILDGVERFFRTTADAIADIFGGLGEMIDGFINDDVKKQGEGLAKIVRGIVNLVISVVEGGANLIVDATNVLIGFLNNLRIDVPEGVPIVGGMKFGFSIPKFSRLEIPRLATGAVIPPNREFMAVLGDQKSGTNIEAPLDTIVQAFRTALNEQGGGRRQTIQLVCDKRVFAELTYDMYNLRSGQLGVKLGGGAK